MELKHEQVEKAVSAALQQIMKKKKAEIEFFDTPEKVWLLFVFKKVPQLNNKIIKLNLPHGLYTDSQMVSLFVKDLDRKSREHSDTVFHYKELLSEHGVKEISEIIPLKALKTMYKAFEAKRNLSNSFDIHLADERIVRLLPAQLGKHFYGRKRHPVQVNLTGRDLKKEIGRAINNSRCIIGGRGSSCSAYVAHLKQTVTQIADNVISAAQQIAQSIPGGADNIRSFHIKTETSAALPIYVSLCSANDIKLPPVETKIEEIEAEDVTTVMEGKVRVFPGGDIEIVTEASEQKRKRKMEQKANQNRSSMAKKMKANEPKLSAFVTRKGRKMGSKLIRAPGKIVKKQKRTRQTKSKKLRTKPLKTGRVKNKGLIDIM